MFDYVECEVPLPDGWVAPGGQYQSKDHDCTLTTLKITLAGRLLVKRPVYEDVPEAERPPEPPDNPTAGLSGALERIWWLQSDRRWVRDEWDDAEHHGYLRFYASEALPRVTVTDVTGRAEPLITEKLVWHDYRAKFTDGQLVEIIQLPECDLA